MHDKNMKELAYFGEQLVKATRQSAGF